MGGTMRLGADPVKLHEGTRAREIYGEAVIYERHRHRYEVNNHLRKRLEHAGLIFSGTSPDDRLVEIVELPDHPSSSRRSSTRSSSRGRCARSRCSASSWARRSVPIRRRATCAKVRADERRSGWPDHRGATRAR